MLNLFLTKNKTFINYNPINFNRQCVKKAKIKSSFLTKKSTFLYIISNFEKITSFLTYFE